MSETQRDAPETRREYATEGFGRVSRTTGIVFKYVLLAATLVGILSLGILLAYVAVDAFQPQKADPAWYAVYALTLVAPTLLAAGYVRRRAPGATFVGLQALGVVVAGAMFGAGISVLFLEVVSVNVWFAYALALAVCAGITLAHRRLRPDAGDVERGVVALAALAAALAGVPPAVLAVPVLPARWILMALSAGAVVAAAARWWARARWESVRAGQVAAAGTLAAAALGGALALVVGAGRVGSVSGVLVALAVVVPAGLYVADVVAHRPADRIGLVVPVILVVGLVVGWAVVEAAGIRSPPSWFDWAFLTSGHSNTPEEAGVYPALVGSVMLMVLVVVLSFPVGVGAAVYLEEYARDSWFTRLVQVNIANLAGVPSVVYGLLALGVFIRIGGLTTGSLLVAGIALSLLILPIVIISAQESIRAVPDSMRQASYGMGATRYQTVRNVVLPRALPGILTGTILALGRALGETAPLIMIGAPAVGSIPEGLQSRVVALPMQVFSWASTFASPEFFDTALAAGVVTLLLVLLVMNSVAIVVRNKYERRH